MPAVAVATSDAEEATGVDSEADEVRAAHRMRQWRVPRARATSPCVSASATPPVPRGATASPAVNGGPPASGAAHAAHAPPAAPAPVRHHLRTRKLAQIHPYTIEALHYRRELYKNDWQDAVVSQREWRHALRINAAHTASRDVDADAFQADEEASDGARSPSLGAASSSSSASESSHTGSEVARPPQHRRAAAHSIDPASPAPAPAPAPAPTSPPPRASSDSPPGPSDSPASDDSTDYERRFRVLKRMMPAHMARACIDDLRAMRHGHAYEPTGSDASDADDARQAASSPSPLRPGESRRRRGVPADGRAPLLSDLASSDSEEDSPPSFPPLHDTDVRWWCAPPRTRSPPVRETDVVDRMLTRAGGARGFGQRVTRDRGRLPWRHAARRRRPRASGASPAPKRLDAPAAHLRGARRDRRTRRAASADGTTSGSSDADASAAASAAAHHPVPSGGAPHIFALPVQDRVYGLATRRGDVQSFARLPYLPGATRAETIDMGDHDALLTPPLVPRTWHPKPVRRRAGTSVRAPLGGMSGAATGEARPASPAPTARNGAPGAPVVAAPAPAPAWHPPRLPSAWEQATLDTPELQAALADLLSFDTLANVSLQFHLQLPAPGVRFAPTTQIARGRLYALLQADRDVRAGDVPTLHLFGHTLRAWLGIHELEQVLPTLLDQVWEALQEDAVLRPVHDLLFFLSEWLGWHAQRPVHFSELALQAGEAPVDDEAVGALGARLLDWTFTLLERGVPAHGARRLRLAVLWFRVQVQFKVHAAAPALGTDHAVLEAAQPLMVHLLAEGVHHSMAHIAHAMDGIDDEPTELWIALVHVLDRLDHAFYDVLEAALDEWQAAAPAAPVVWSERVWYLVFATSIWARFGAAAGVARTAPVMPPCWALVHRALSLPLRFDARVERAAPRALLRRRDAYVRIVVTRCVLLTDTFAWPLLDAEAVLGRVFDVFDAHRLTDLPTETDHDFAPFLRKYDAALLDAPPQGNAFHVFLQLLGRAGTQLVAQGEARQAARLFSRMTPVRVMPFTPSNLPTSAERAALFNHYSIVMLFLYFVPSAALQRLRQIRSFLTFPEADRVSQVTCVRAMVYCGTLFRHHALPLEPVIAWFVDVCRAAAADVRAAHAAPPRDRRAAHHQNEAARVLLGVLRGVQHLVQHSALHPDAPPSYPPPELLHAAWTDELLGMDAAIDAEIVQGLLLFLEQRAALRGTDDDEFDDAFLADPQLAALLGEPEPSGPVRRVWDAEADGATTAALHTRISPALFACLAHPPRASPAPAESSSLEHAQVEALVAHAERDVRLAELVACWAACAHVLVQNEVRTWQSYLTLGAESWKRISDNVQKREVALHLALAIARLDAVAFQREAWELLGVWFHCIGAPHATLQGVLTARLREVDPAGLLEGVQVDVEAPSLAQRAAALDAVLGRLEAALADAVPVLSVGFAIQCVSALLSSARAYWAQTADASYRTWVAALLARLDQLPGALRRGIATELHATASLL